jgi:hypothetical protein
MTTTLTADQLLQAWEQGPESYIRLITDAYLAAIGGQVTAENIAILTPDQHTLLAYRYMLDEVMEGGFVQLIQNGLGPYVLSGPFALMLKKQWGMKDFAKFIHNVRHEYHAHKAELEAELDEEEFMALYEKFETLNELGDDFLDVYQESVTPDIAGYVRQHESDFI